MHYRRWGSTIPKKEEGTVESIEQNRGNCGTADFVDGFLSNYPEEVQAISRKLRDIARHGMKKAQEFLYYNAITYSLSGSPLDRICYIRPLKKRVTFGFLFGRRLNDPDHLLRGIGKRARYVKVTTIEDTKRHGLKDLVKAAWNDGASSVAELRQTMKNRRADLRRSSASHQRTKLRGRSQTRRQ